MSHTVIGLFNNRNAAEAAAQELIQRGFTDENVDVSYRSTTGTETGANTASTQNSTTTQSSTAQHTTRQDTTTQIEITDSVGNFFGSLFGDDQTTARNYTEAAGNADAILTVHADSYEKARQAAEILDRNGAIDIDAATSENSQRNLTQTTETTTQNTTQTVGTNEQTAANVQSETTIPIIEEQLQVGKREVERGGARIRSRIIEKPVEASVRLRQEHVVVNRHPVNRALTDADLANVQEGDIQVTERTEVPVVSKQAHVVEEVLVGKNVTEHEETIRDTVKRTDVEVEEVNHETTPRSADNNS